MPQDSVWTTHMARWAPRLEPVNLAADGYSMAQAYLRFRQAAAELDYHVAILGVVPTVDLWRDINVIRDLGEFWNFPYPMPRAVLSGDELSLVPPFYDSLDMFFAENHPDLSAKLAAHLRQYDRFYFRARYESPPVIGHSVIYKTAAAAWANRQEVQLRRQIQQPTFEATSVTQSILAAMQAETAADGADFVALILPVEYRLNQLRDDLDFANSWRETIDALCSEIDNCVDLAPILTALPAECIDSGADGTHYGPRLNEVLARVALRILGEPGAEKRAASTACEPLGSWRSAGPQMR